MAFNSNPPRLDYETSAGQTVFPFNFKIFFTSDIYIYHTTPTQTVLLTEGTDYTVIIDGDNGGTVTLEPVVVIDTGDFIVLERNLEIDRLVDYQTSGDLLATTLNADQDYQTYLVADLQARSDQAITAPPGVPGFDGTLPPPIAEAYLRWASDARSLENDVTPPTWRDETLQYRNEAEAFSNSAGVSASNAATSETNASNSAAAALVSENNAALSETNAADSAILAEYWAEQSAINNGAPQKNLFINGSLAIWQRTTSISNSTTTQYVADRWLIEYRGSGNVSFERDVGVAGHFKYIGKGLLAGSDYLTQIVRDGIELYSGRDMNVSFYSPQSLSLVHAFTEERDGTGGIANQVEITLTQVASTVPGYNRFSGTFVCPTYASTQHLGISFQNTNVAGKLANLKLELGTVATDFEREDSEDVLIQCEPYYQKSYDIGVFDGTDTNGGVVLGIVPGAGDIQKKIYVDLKRSTVRIPDVLLYSKTGAGNSMTVNSVSVAASPVNVSTKSFRAYSDATSVSVVGDNMLVHYTADAELY